MSAFRTQRIKTGSLKDRLLGREAKENGFVKINNALAQQHCIYHTPKEDIYRIIDQYHIRAKNKQDKSHFLRLYARLFKDTLSKHHLFDQRVKELKFLKNLFSLSDKDVHIVHNSVVNRHYHQDLEQLLAIEHGGPLSEVEQAFLVTVRNTLQLPEKISATLRQKSAKLLLEEVLQPSEKDHALVNGAGKELFDMLRSALSIEVKHIPTYLQLKKYCLYYQIENDKVPVLPSPRLLPRHELCYLNIKAEMYERRRKVRYIHYDGLSLHVKTMQGTYWRTGLDEKRTLAPDVWRLIDTGDLYLTSKHLLLGGERKQHALPLGWVSNFTCYENGIEVQKKDGTGVFFKIHFHNDLVALLLGKILED